VLPFKPLGDDQKENYIGLSVADSIIMRISRADALVVRPTSAVRQYATEDTDALNAGETLGVDAVLDGTWQRQDDRVRISVNLLRVSDGSSLWTELFDTRADDIFVLQDQVSDQLASRLRVQLEVPRQGQRRRSGTRSTEAYDAYAKGQFYFGERRPNGPHANLETAISLFERAVSVDKDFADAHAYLGYAYAFSAVFREDNAALIERAKAELNTAERLRPNLGIVHHARAFIWWSKYSGWRIVEALREQRLAAQLDPGLADIELGALYWHLGFLDEWRMRAEHALDRDPTNQIAKLTYVHEHFMANRPEEGLAVQKRLFNTGPDQRYFLLTRRASDAAPLVEKAASQSPDNGEALKNLALLRALQGRHAEAQALVPEIFRVTPKNRSYHHITYDVARVYAVAGDAEQTARWLDETIQWGMPNYPMFAEDRFLDRVRESPPVAAIMADLKNRWDRYREELR
jgi:TolB-like protein